MLWKSGKSRKKFNQTSCAEKIIAESGQTLVEVMVAVGLLGLMLTALYGGFSSSFAVVRVARENLRATQILEERMEVLRLVKWSDLLTPGFIPTNFTAPFFTSQPTNAPSQSGFYYSGTVAIGNAALNETYSNSVRMIQIGLTWTSGNMVRQRQMTSFVSQYGMQNYIY
jgi:type II secretory pathway pseudopilin PulG